MREPIAKIALCPGQVGYYDEYSRIHLTLGKPEAVVYSGTNCAQIRRSIKAGTIRLVSGTLGEQVPPFKIVKTKTGAKLVSNVVKEHAPVYAQTKVEDKVETIVEAKAEKTPVVEETPAAEPVIEEQVEEATVAEEAKEVAEEATEQTSETTPATKKRAGRRKKATTEK